MNGASPTQQDVRDALQELYTKLNTAYWDATTIQTKDRLRGLAEAVEDVISTLNAQQINENTVQFAQLQATMGIINTKLTQLKADINNIIHNIQTTRDVATGIDKALGIAAKFFKLVA